MSEHFVLHYYSDANNRVHNHTHLEYRNKIKLNKKLNMTFNIIAM